MEGTSEGREQVRRFSLCVSVLLLRFTRRPPGSDRPSARRRGSGPGCSVNERGVGREEERRERACVILNGGGRDRFASGARTRDGTCGHALQVAGRWGHARAHTVKKPRSRSSIIEWRGRAVEGRGGVRHECGRARSFPSAHPHFPFCRPRRGEPPSPAPSWPAHAAQTLLYPPGSHPEVADWA
jgi:hypothetical protein